MERNLGLTRRDRLVLLALSAVLAAAAVCAWITRRPGRYPLPSTREAGIRVNINSAGWEELTLLPGIGEKTARLILADRETNGRYKNIEDLGRIKGIGPAMIRRIAPHADCE